VFYLCGEESSGAGRTLIMDRTNIPADRVHNVKSRVLTIAHPKEPLWVRACGFVI